VTPLRAKAVESALLGQKLTPASIREAAALVRDEVDPLDDVRGSAAYKREMARVWTERTIASLANIDLKATV
jgi:aerobic carbon-monoxide dehydrogenase medium subunit